MSFSRDGSRVVTAITVVAMDGGIAPLGGGLRVWDVANGKELLSIQRRSRASWKGAAFSPDGQRIVTASNSEDGENASKDERGVLVWDAFTGKRLLALEGRVRAFTNTAFSPDGSLIVAISGVYGKPGEVQVWDSATGRERFTLKGHTGLIANATFSRDNKRIATVASSTTGQGNEIKLWDATNGQELLSLRSRGSDLYSIVFSVDTWRLLGVGDVSDKRNEPLEIWDATPLSDVPLPEIPPLFGFKGVR